MNKLFNSSSWLKNVLPWIVWVNNGYVSHNLETCVYVNGLLIGPQRGDLQQQQ